MHFEMDHVAVQTGDVAKAVEFYTRHFDAEVLYQDSTWAFLRIGQGKLALVTPSQHPPHVALRVTEADLALYASRLEIPIDTHRDGTKGIYMPDPDGNQIELISYPPGETVYEK